MKPAVNLTNVDVSDILKAPKMATPAGGGGGGGSHDIVDPMKGKLPPRMKDPDYATDGADPGEAEAGVYTGDQCAEGHHSAG